MREERAMSPRVSGQNPDPGEILQSQVPARMAGAAALLFIPASTGGVNVVYRRGDDGPVRPAARLGLGGEYPFLARFLPGTVRGRIGFTT
jgi:hypothetical protein